MCGIVSYCGSKDATNIILDGLERLEYRGYDSAGISLITKDSLKTIKKRGRLENLRNEVSNYKVSSNVGIGHTRWATHGEPNEVNAHPHINENNTISVVHNGIIENYVDIKNELLNLGYKFKSETDTEVIVQLMDHYYDGNLLNALIRTTKKLKGAYAICAVSINNPSELVAIRHQSPLVLGIADDGYILSSDVAPIIEHTKKVIYLDDDEFVSVNLNYGYKVLNDNLDILEKEISTVDWDLEAASKDGYDHFMIIEIYEQPSIIRNEINLRTNNGLNLSEDTFTKEEFEKFNSIYIVACGTALHAGEIGKYAIEKFTGKKVECQIASEFRYDLINFTDEHTLLILISQSGETADSLSALREAKEKGATVFAITNVVGSSIARESHKVLYCHAGPEISVASTKAYTAQILSLYLFALDYGKKIGKLNDIYMNNFIDELKQIPDKMDQLLKDLSIYRNIATEFEHLQSAFYTGRTVDYISAKEGALKLKEISYIHTEAFASGELKHGSIALIDENTKVIAISTQKDIAKKTSSNVEELAARGAKVFSITFEGNELLKLKSDKIIYLPKTDELLYPLLTALPIQCIAYYTALVRGNDVDKPRNLAKSVTVE